MMIHQALAEFLGSTIEGLAYSEGPGGNIFVDDMPEAPNRGVALYTQGGVEADSQLPYDEPSVQIMVRGDSSPVWALNMWASLYSTLQGLRDQTIVGQVY